MLAKFFLQDQPMLKKAFFIGSEWDKQHIDSIIRKVFDEGPIM